MLQYTFKIKHDDGKVIMRVIATSLDAAITKIETAENCPRSAMYLMNISPIDSLTKKLIAGN